MMEIKALSLLLVFGRRRHHHHLKMGASSWLLSSLLVVILLLLPLFDLCVLDADAAVTPQRQFDAVDAYMESPAAKCFARLLMEDKKPKEDEAMEFLVNFPGWYPITRENLESSGVTSAAVVNEMKNQLETRTFSQATVKTLRGASMQERMKILLHQLIPSDAQTALINVTETQKFGY